MPRLPRFMLAFALLIGLVPATAFAQAHFTARLDGPQELPPLAVPAAGSGSFTLTSLGVQFFITMEKLSGPITGARIFDGPPGLPGVPVRDILPEFAGTNTAAGLWTAGDPQPLTPALIEALMRGDLHVNVYTAANPGGEARGQIRLSAGAHFTANLQGAQVNPPVAVAGTGAGSFTLTEQGLHYKLTVNGLTGPILTARIVTGAIGVNGGAVFDMLPTFSGNTAMGLVTTLTPTDRKNLIAGNLYVLIATPANPAGELRGQIVLAGGFGLSGPMDGTQETPPNAAPGLGTVSATLTPSGLMVDFSANSLTGAITIGHIHRGPPGVMGPPVRTISAAEYLSARSGSLLWRYDDPEPLTPAMVAELLQGNLYLNLHTAAFPGGEIRGQLLPNHPGAAAIATYTANLTGNEEEPPIPAPGLGTGNFVLLPGGLRFRITVEGLSGGITGAHFHLGGIGVGGGAIVRGIVAAEFISPTTMEGTWSPVDPQPLTPALITELIKGNLYFNVHTVAAPGGEIRGQLLPASGAEFEARLTGAQETPPLGVAGSGTGSFTLTQHGLSFDITWDALTGPAIDGHIHQGDPGIAGGVVRAFVPGELVTSNTLAGVWKPSDAMPLTPAMVTALMKGDLYVNIHTAANPAGEIRGQITISGGRGFDARLTGSQEVGPVVTPGLGTAAFTLADIGMVFRLTGNDLMGALTDAHFHDAPPGVNGPIVRSIIGEFVSQTGDGVWKPTDASPLTPALLASLLRGDLYVNLHTAAVPTGEIRGQIGSRSTVAVGPPVWSSPGIDLAQAPNPLTGRGRISFRLSRPAAVRLTLHDLSGAEVARLVDGWREAGAQEVPLEAGRLPAGVYFYLLRTPEGEGRGKMVVLD